MLFLIDDFFQFQNRKLILLKCFLTDRNFVLKSTHTNLRRLWRFSGKWN